MVRQSRESHARLIKSSAVVPSALRMMVVEVGAVSAAST
jgi:hypothetical protein